MAIEWKYEKFTMTRNHIKLLRGMYVGWNDCEFGAPEIDPKRPYGNSQVYTDIGETLGIEPEGGVPDDREFTNEQRIKMDKLHAETQTALQIVLKTGEFKPGVYTCREYSIGWKFIHPI